MKGHAKRPVAWLSTARLFEAFGRVPKTAMALGFAAWIAPLVLAGVASAGSKKEIVEWPIESFPEPSGIVYHPGRKSLFVAGDEGDVGEVDLSGKLLRTHHLGGDLEGMACDPASGMLYVVREGHEVIYELSPDDLEVTRRFSIDRAFQGDPNFLRRGGDGIEGLTFVPIDGHPEGGRFYAVNQYDPAVLLELAVPLRSSTQRFETVRIVRSFPLGRGPLSGLTWASGWNAGSSGAGTSATGASDVGSSKDGSPSSAVAEASASEGEPSVLGTTVTKSAPFPSGVFLVVSSLWRKVYLVDTEGKQFRSVRIPALMPEGFALLPDGSFVIAQDTGGLIVWKPETNPFDG